MNRIPALVALLATIAAPAFAAGPRVRTPPAYPEFCAEYAECDAVAGTHRPSSAMNDITAVNAVVNRGIRPQPNLGGSAAEWWGVWPEAGDCNDYAVTKRHELLARGWGSGELLLAVAFTPAGEGHLVLIAGGWVLDNLTAAILRPRDTTLRFTRIQNEDDPRMWNAPDAAPDVSRAR
jgi:predicted transglutaminase-like cysteine proteinase